MWWRWRRLSGSADTDVLNMCLEKKEEENESATSYFIDFIYIFSCRLGVIYWDGFSLPVSSRGMLLMRGRTAIARVSERKSEKVVVTEKSSNMQIHRRHETNTWEESGDMQGGWWNHLQGPGPLWTGAFFKAIALLLRHSNSIPTGSWPWAKDSILALSVSMYWSLSLLHACFFYNQSVRCFQTISIFFFFNVNYYPHLVSALFQQNKKSLQ